MTPSLVPAITVVIPARNAATTLAAQLEALARQRDVGHLAVIVVDNASTDNTAELASSHDSPAMSVRVVVESRTGINWARNAGVTAADTDAVLLCDADDVVGHDWVRSMQDALTPGTWVAGPLDFVQLNDDRTRQLWGGRAATPMTGPEPFRDFGNGSNCGFMREMWESLGKFDVSVVGHGDETEFFARAWAAGYRLQWAPSAVVHHRQRTSARGMLRSRFRQGKSQVRISMRPRWPQQAPQPTITAALRSLAGGVRLAVVAAIKRQSIWPGAGIAALNLGRAWQLLSSSTSRPTGAKPTR